MVVCSTLRAALFKNVIKSTNGLSLRSMSGNHHNVFTLQPSRFQWRKFKDVFHYYLMLGVIPAGLLILYSNIFIGPATLSEIPEDYVPKHWEYYKHPLSRAMARYILPSPQQEHEKYLHFIYEEDQKRRIHLLENEIKEKIRERTDYQAYYFRTIKGKYQRATKETADNLKVIGGD